MAILDVRLFRALFTLLVFGLGLGFVCLAWRTLLVFLFAILFAYLLEPMVARVDRLGWGRHWSVAVIYVVLLSGLGLFLFYFSPRLAHQSAHLLQSLPALSQRVATGQIAQQMGSERGWSESTQFHARQFLAEHHNQLQEWQNRGIASITAAARYLIWLVVIPILAAFFLLSGRRFADAILDQLSRRRQRQLVQSLLDDMHDVLAGYIRAQIMLTALAMLVYAGGFALMRVPFALTLAAVAGMLEFIPVVGPLTAAVLVLGTGFALDYPNLWALVVFLGIWRLVQDYFNSPRLMGDQVQLHPLAVLFGVFAGAEIAGVIGVYLSIPVLAILRVLWRQWRAFEANRILAASETPQLIPPSRLAS